MKNFSLSFVSDLIFTAFSTFILSFVLINYFLPRIPTIIFSLTLSLIFSTIFYQKRSKKTRAERIKKTDRKNLERKVLELNFMSEKNALSLFKKAFESKNIKVEMRKDHLFLPEKDTLVFIKCDLDGATKKDVVKAFNLLNENMAEIYTTTDDIDLVSFANRFDGKIKILDSHKIYKLLKDVHNISLYNISQTVRFFKYMLALPRHFCRQKCPKPPLIATQPLRAKNAIGANCGGLERHLVACGVFFLRLTASATGGVSASSPTR